jgi:hypothetical protein
MAGGGPADGQGVGDEGAASGGLGSAGVGVRVGWGRVGKQALVSLLWPHRERHNRMGVLPSVARA